MGPTEWVAVSGILGTIAGAFVGAWATMRTQEQSLRQEERSRFHLSRLDAYTEVFSSAFVLSLKPTLERRWSEELIEFNNRFERARLLATIQVDGCLERFARVLMVYHNLEKEQVEHEMSGFHAAYSRTAEELRAAIREELGVEALHPRLGRGR